MAMVTETKMPQNCTFHKQSYSSLAFFFFTLIHYFQESMKVGEVIPHTGPIPIVIPLKLFLDFLRDPVFPRGLTDSQSYAPIFANDATHCVGIRPAVNIDKNGDIWLASWGKRRAGENGMSNFIFSPPPNLLFGSAARRLGIFCLAFQYCQLIFCTNVLEVAVVIFT